MLNLKLMSEKTEFELKTEQKRKEKKRVLCMYALRKNILTLVKETSVRKLSCDSLDESFIIVDCIVVELQITFIDLDKAAQLTRPGSG